MTIRVAKGVVDHIVKYPGSISLQVQGAADPEAAAIGLRAALEEIETLGSTSFSEGGDALTPNSVGGVAIMSGGPITSVNAPMVPEPELARIPAIVASHLRAAGVATAVIALPPTTGPLDLLEHTPRAVTLRLYPPRLADPLQAPPLPPGWVEQATRWLLDHTEADVVHVRDFPVQFPLLVADVAAFVGTPRHCVLMAGDLNSRAWAVHLCGSLVLGFGGPAATDAEMVAAAKSFAEIARGLAPEVAQAFVDIADRFGVFGNAAHGTPWYGSGGESPIFVEYLCDELCFEGFPYQVLGPGHLARLAGASVNGTLPPQFRPLDDGRAELAVSEPAAWLPGSPAQPGLLEQARSLLAPCLFRRHESSPIIEERRARARRAAEMQDPSIRPPEGQEP